MICNGEDDLGSLAIPNDLRLELMHLDVCAVSTSLLEGVCWSNRVEDSLKASFSDGEPFLDKAQGAVYNFIGTTCVYGIL